MFLLSSLWCSSSAVDHGNQDGVLSSWFTWCYSLLGCKAITVLKIYSSLNAVAKELNNYTKLC